jgi:glycosidase
MKTINLPTKRATIRHYFALVFALFLSFSCTKKDKTGPAATISALNCASASAAVDATVGIDVSTTITVPYDGGNGVTFNAGTPIASTVVSGLTATLQAGTLATFSGNLTYQITGKAAAEGVAAFAISFADKSCSINLKVVKDLTPVQYGTPFAGVPDRQDVTIYQVNMRAFSTQSNLQGVIARLDSIKALGTNVIYLMPIFPVGTLKAFNSPYCVKDYQSVGPEFGTLDDLRKLVDDAHAKNMSVVLDWVPNHTSWDNPWISSHKDWYAQDAAGNIIIPPGTTYSDVAQLNYSNAALRKEMINSMKYWIYTANIDGFRCDYADGVPFSFWQEAVTALRGVTTHKLLLLAEGSRGDHFTAGFDYTFGFNFYGQMRTIFSGNQAVTKLENLNASEYSAATNGQHVVRYLDNHDVNGSDGTAANLFGGAKGALAAFAVVAYMKGIPMIYNGQEVGMTTRLVFPFTGADINWTPNPTITEEYKKIIAFRNSSTAIRRGTLTTFSTADICAFTKEQGTERVFVASNLRNAANTYTLPANVANSTWTDALTGATVNLTTQLSLGAYGYVVLKK